MDVHKETAISLRKEGKSYREINKELGVPLGTLSKWLSGEEWSKNTGRGLKEKAQKKGAIRLEDWNQTRGLRLKAGYEKAREEAKTEFEILKNTPLFIAGMMLYMGGGDRNNKNQLRLGSSNPELIRLFCLFLTSCCHIPEEKVRAHLAIYPNMDEVSSRRFWSFATGIPFERFTKSTVLKGLGRTNRLGNGVCTVIVSNTSLKVKLLEWLALLPKELMQKQ